MSTMLSMKSAIAPSLPTRVCRKNRSVGRKSFAVKALAIDQMVHIGEASVGVASMYFMMSYNEYATHRYYQHNEVQKLQVFKDAKAKYPDVFPKLDGGGHVEHHAETLDDMSLKTDDRWKQTTACKKLDDSGDPWRGTAFSYEVTKLMTYQMAPQVYLWYMGAMHWGFLDTTAFFGSSMLLHALIWNALHPAMHGLPDVPASVGAPSFLLSPLKGSGYFRWLYDNHAGHHVSGGVTNYNVACPLFDHILGTYEEPAVWKQTMEAKALQNAQKSNAVQVEMVESV